VTMKNVGFWDVTRCGSCKNRRFGGTYQVEYLRCGLLLVVTANVHTSPILVALKVEAILSSEMSVNPRTTRRNIPEDGILPVKVWFSWLGSSVHVPPKGIGRGSHAGSLQLLRKYRPRFRRTCNRSVRLPSSLRLRPDATQTASTGMDRMF
jgi:hypothetical protein